MLQAKAGFDGEDMALVQVPESERSAKIGEPGYNAMNENTMKRAHASKFHKNIYSRWAINEKNRSRMRRGDIAELTAAFRRRRYAADVYMVMAELANGGFSANGYEDVPPPEHYGPKGHPAEKRMTAAKWLHGAHGFVGAKHSRILWAAMVQHRTMAQIFAGENAIGRKQKATAYRRGSALVDAAFDRLAEYLDENPIKKGIELA